MESDMNQGIRKLLVKNFIYQYKAVATRVVDGDTIDFEVDLGFHLKKKIRVRLMDIDTPELRGGTDESKALAREVKQFVIDQLFSLVPMSNQEEYRGDEVYLTTEKTGSFGRWLGQVYFANGETLSQRIRNKYPQIK